MVYYKLLQTIIIITALAKVIGNIIVWHHSLPKSIISKYDLVFLYKFKFFFCYFLNIN